MVMLVVDIACDLVKVMLNKHPVSPVFIPPVPIQSNRTVAALEILRCNKNKDSNSRNGSDIIFVPQVTLLSTNVLLLRAGLWSLVSITFCNHEDTVFTYHNHTDVAMALLSMYNLHVLPCFYQNTVY